MDSMSSPITLLCDRFQAMKLKDEPIAVGFPASEKEMQDTLEHLRFIEPIIESEENLSAEQIKKSEVLQKFMDSH